MLLKLMELLGKMERKGNNRLIIKNGVEVNDYRK